jgi:hypothetical protein
MFAFPCSLPTLQDTATSTTTAVAAAPVTAKRSWNDDSNNGDAQPNKQQRIEDN